VNTHIPLVFVFLSDLKRHGHISVSPAVISNLVTLQELAELLYTADTNQMIISLQISQYEVMLELETYLTRALTANLTTVDNRKSGVTRMWNRAKEANALAGLSLTSSI